MTQSNKGISLPEEFVTEDLTLLEEPIETPGSDPKEKPELEPERLPKEDPGIQPSTEPGKEDDDDRKKLRRPDCWSWSIGGGIGD